MLLSPLFVRNYYQFTINFYTSASGCGCGVRIEQKFWQINGFGEKRHRSADLHTPIHSPPSPPLTLIGKKSIRSWSSTISLSTVRKLQPWTGEKALGTRLRNLLISWKPIMKTKEKKLSSTISTKICHLRSIPIIHWKCCPWNNCSWWCFRFGSS